MTRRPRTPCRYPGCTRLLTSPGYCADHERKRKSSGNVFRARCPLYDTARWRAQRAAFLASHPLCWKCAERGQTTPATVVDHHIPHDGDYDRFFDVANWRPLCEKCHNAKTAATDGGFGNARRKVSAR